MTGLTWLWILLAALATVVAYFVGRRSGWMRGWADCEARDLIARGYNSGWRDRGEFERRQGVVISEKPAAPASA